ncbi:MAG TPA: tetratricopeptide repeat protein, partial [Terriglobales bacterium]
CNYPPTQSWFDEGLAEYFSSLRLEDNQAQIGADPSSFVALLSSQPWMPLAQLFETKFDTTHKQPAAPGMFQAESWIVMHYLVTQDKMPETGAFLGLVEAQHVAVAQAIQQAYGMSAAQLEQTIKAHLQTFSAAPPAPAKPVKGSTLTPVAGGRLFAPPVTDLDIGTSTQPVPAAEAQALLAEMMVRLPEHREAAVQQLEKLIDDLNTRNPIEHRALAWVYLEQGKDDEAAEQLQKAINLDEHDAWAHYYFARMKYRSALASGSQFPGLANMLIDLRTVLDWDPEFAEAFNMLAMGRVEGGGVNSAVEAMRSAVELSPRNETYLLHLAVTYLAAKKWDDASGLLEHLKSNENAKIAGAAKNYLQELPNMRQFGVLPKRYLVEDIPVKPKQSAAKAEEEDSNAPVTPPEPPLDRRKTVFARGRLLRVDCSHPPEAVITITGKTRTLRLRTDDFHSLLLLGADDFSCSWKNLAVTVNYKAGGKADGDLVSLEIRP